MRRSLAQGSGCKHEPATQRRHTVATSRQTEPSSRLVATQCHQGRPLRYTTCRAVSPTMELERDLHSSMEPLASAAAGPAPTASPSMPTASHCTSSALGTTESIAGPSSALEALLHLPFQGNLSRMDRVPSALELQQLLLRALEAAAELRRLNPRIDNLDRVLRRIRGDLAFLTRCIEAGQEQVAAADAQQAATASGTAAAAAAAGEQQQRQQQLPGVTGLDPAASASATAVAMDAAAADTAQTADAAVGSGAAVARDIGGPLPSGALQAPVPASCGSEERRGQGAGPGGPAGPGAWAGGPAGPGESGAGAGGPPGPGAAVQRSGVVLDATRIQGIVNNLRGFQGELQAACYAPGVTGLLKRFYMSPQRSTPVNSQRAPSTASQSGVTPKRGGKRKGGQQEEGGGGKEEEEVQAKKQESGGSGGGRRSTDAGDSWGPCSSVEVDVVAQEGCTWIEVKSHERFGLDSVHWTGQQSVKGLCRQVQDLIACSQAECNLRRWQPPRVVIFFPSPLGTSQAHTPTASAGACPAGVAVEGDGGSGSHVDAAVVSELRRLGAHVVTDVEGLRAMPPPPPPPTVTNLDVTTLCALISEACHAPLDNPQLEAWSLRNVHWRGCWQAEKEQGRLVQELQPWLTEERRLVVSPAAVQQFELLLGQFGGPRERERWQQLRQRVHVLGSAPGSHPGKGSNADCMEQREEGQGVEAACTSIGVGADGAGCQVSSMTSRVAALDKITDLQRAVFGAGDALQALTLTANGNAVRSAERQGVYLEAVVHRAAWLSGF